MTEMVQYLGRAVPKDGFRTFVYGLEDQAKLVESWGEYLEHVASGLWFPTKDAVINKPVLKKKERY